MIRTAWPAMAALLLILGAAAGCAPPPRAPHNTVEWRNFQGSWSATGRRHVVAFERGGQAAAIEMSGAVTIETGEGLSRGFHGELVAYDNGEGKSEGRGVWTDENGDKVFSRLTGQAVRGGQRITGTVTGGTGRYSGLEGEYALTWQFVVVDHEGGLQVRTATLAGRVRRDGGAQ